ncbi:TPA: hypothetical protein ACNVDZ_004853 [Citrobacter freundii]|nr:hypothetical protein [Salmonella enterica]
MAKETVFKCNVHTDVSDYKELSLNEKEMDIILQNNTTTIVIGKTGKGKKAHMESCLRTKPSRTFVSDN